MNAKTLTALKGAIVHWKRMRDNPFCGERPSASECPLCVLFGARTRCKGCPVMKYTGLAECLRTPYHEAERAFRGVMRTGLLEGWRAAAQEEIDFLENLLPKEKP